MDNTKNSIAIEAMQAVIEEYSAKINHLQESILLLGGSPVAAHSASSITPSLSLKAPVNLANIAGNLVYPYGKKMRYKVQYIFERENRFMLIREVNEYLIQLEPSMEYQLTLIRNAITNMKVDKLLTSIKTGRSNQSYVWGKPEWLDENGNIKPEHYYNTDLPEVD